ncbi:MULTISPECIES: FAD-dependent oxidoreductase [unclassified Streptomyces]|uniref:NAD(P)/FAD-dependent oxidoreductase n=1 Tax=unclassified Streptomyces TaxID=2593676 RepID=UPI0013A6D74D|nr:MULTISPECIES: FAD-dependent oxidoreductase [unclassified Streptomyces]
MITADIAIVGNGILALSTAFELTARDASLSVAVIGPEDRAGAATPASGAMLNCFAEITKYTLRSDASRAKFAMCRDALALWPSWLDRIGEASGHDRPHTVSGTVVIENAVSGELDSENFDAMLDAVAKYGEAHELISPRSIAGLDPTPTARPLRALFLPDEGAADSAAVYGAVRAALDARGVRFVPYAARALTRDGDKVTGAVLENGDQVRAGTTLVAAGAFTTPLLDTVLGPDDVQPVFSGTGIAAVTHRSDATPFHHVVRSVNRAGSCGLHAVPFPGGRDYLGATNVVFATPRTLPSAGLSHFLLQCAIDQLNNGFAFSEIMEWRVGNRPVSLDTFPLIGRGPLDGLHIATGTYRDGFHNSPLIAAITASEILGGAEGAEEADGYDHPFVPARRPISVFTAAESAGETAYQGACTGFEASLVLPRLWRHQAVPTLFSQGAVRLYEDLGAAGGAASGEAYGFSPDLVPFLVAGLFSEDGPDREAYLRVKSLLGSRGASVGLETAR